MASTGPSRTAKQPRSIPWSLREPAAALSLVAAFVVLRSTGLGAPLPEAWAAVAAIVALVSPLTGLLTAVALGPFDDWPVLGTEAGGRAVLVAAVAISVTARALPEALGRWRARDRQDDSSHEWLQALWTPPGVALSAAGIVLIGTGLGVIHTALRFGPTPGYQAAQLWGTGTGMALVVLFIGGWFGRQGATRSTLVAIVAGAAAVAAVSLGLLHEALPGLLVSSPLGWLIAVDGERLRLRGIMTAPNAMAMLGLLPICLVAAWMLHRRSLPAWLAGSLVLAVLAVGVLLTFSRSAVLAVAAVAVSYAWYIRRAAAIVMLLVAAVAAVILVPLYLEQRAGTPLPGVGAALQEFLTAGDSVRASGWAATIRMTVDSPLIGQGFRSYVLLHAQFGDVAQQAPHNEWLRLYAEGGVVVGTAGLVFMVTALTALWRMRGVLGLGAFGVLLSYAIMASFNNPLNYAQLNIPVFAVLGTAFGMALRAAPPAGLSDPAAEGPRGSSGA